MFDPCIETTAMGGLNNLSYSSAVMPKLTLLYNDVKFYVERYKTSACNSPQYCTQCNIALKNVTSLMLKFDVFSILWFKYDLTKHRFG